MNLLVIASYPRENEIHGQKTVGVASYTKNTIESLKKADPTIQVIIWSETNDTWKRNSISSLISLSKKLLSIDYDWLLLPHEFNMFGNPHTAIFFPVFLLINKINNKKALLIIHQVVANFSDLSKHNNLPRHLIPLINTIAKIYYSTITHLTDKTIVFDQFLKDRLNFNKNTLVIPHAIESKKIQKNSTPKTFNILSFGYLAHYKGTDWLINTFKNYLNSYPNNNISLTIAGGPNPNYLDKPHYQQYLKKIDEFGRHPQIKMTGFVNENNLDEIFAKSSLVILPYRTAMSSSGPMALACSYHKPFILSNKLEPYTKTFDFKNILENNNLNSRDIIFDLTQSSFDSSINNLIKNPSKLKTLSQISTDLERQRSWPNIAKKYLEILN